MPSVYTASGRATTGASRTNENSSYEKVVSSSSSECLRHRLPKNFSEMISARRTESLDAPNITKLVTPSTEFLFGRVHVINLIEKALLAVTLSNAVEDILGHAAFLDYPNIAKVEPSAWVDWLLSTYELKEWQRKMLRDRYVSSGSKHMVETRLLSFPMYSCYHLPMYAKTGMV